MSNAVQLTDAQLAAIMANGDPTVAAQIQATIAAANTTQPAAARRAPTAGEALTTIGQAIEAVIATGRAFTAHAVTVKARELRPDLELKHETLRGPIKVALANYANVAVTHGAQKGDAEFDLYTPLA